MCSKSYKYLFLEHSKLGQKTNINKPNEIIDKCIKLAWQDMLTAGRYYNLNKNIIVKYKKILKKYLYNNPTSIIEETLNLFGNKEKIKVTIKGKPKYVTRYGLCQKLVNMTFKYFFIFSDYTKLNIDFSKCDCPLDSVILDKINYRKTVWSKLDKNQYIECQNLIKKELTKTSLNRKNKSNNKR